jgi:hypothetical protein
MDDSGRIIPAITATNSELDEMVQTMKAEGQVAEGDLDPNPKTSAGQQRHFYYGTDEADISVNSKVFDALYQHDRSEELTFGSRPPTAPEKSSADAEKEPETPYTPGTDLADNSMVMIG